MNGIPQNYHGKAFFHAWEYRDGSNKLLGVVGRYQKADGKKDIIPFFKRNGPAWAAGIELTPRPLFGLNKLAAHPKDKAVSVPSHERGQ